MQNFLQILEEQTPQKKNKKMYFPKINSKWPPNSSLPKLNLLVKTKNHLYKKNSALFQFYKKKILKNSRWRLYSTWRFFLALSSGVLNW
jgi:hypothetical protein